MNASTKQSASACSLFTVYNISIVIGAVRSTATIRNTSLQFTELHLSTVVNFSSVLWCCWLGGRKGIRPVKKTEWWGASVVISPEQGADLHMAQLMPLPVKSRLVLPFWYWPTRVVPAKGPLNGCVRVSELNEWICNRFYLSKYGDLA